MSPLQLQISSPGLYYEAALPCIPKVRSSGYVRLHFKASSNSYYVINIVCTFFVDRCQLMKNTTKYVSNV